MAHHDRAFRFDHHSKLDSDERRRHQPPGPLVALLASSDPAVIADLGAGTGYFALPLAEALPAARVLALDLEPRMLALLGERAAERGLAERIERRPVEAAPRLPLADGEADAALLASLWHELPEPAATLAELARALAPGGRIVVCDWSPEGSTEHGPPADHRLPAAHCERALAAAGWTAVERHGLYPDHWTVIARRG